MPDTDMQKLQGQETNSFDQMGDNLKEAIDRLEVALTEAALDALHPAILQNKWAVRMERVKGIPPEIRDN